MAKLGTDEDTFGWVGWFALVCTALVSAIAWVELGWLLWRYVPIHAALLEGMGLPLPLTTRITIASSNWFMRLLPLAVLASVFVVPFVAATAVALALKLGAWGRFARWLVASGLAVSLLGLVGCAFVVVSIQRVYSSATLDPRLQENLRAFREFRENQAHRSTVE